MVFTGVDYNRLYNYKIKIYTVLCEVVVEGDRGHL